MAGDARPDDERLGASPRRAQTRHTPVARRLIPPSPLHRQRDLNGMNASTGVCRGPLAKRGVAV
jgi:hypothetical protein